MTGFKKGAKNVSNYCGNLSFSPRYFYAPLNELEVIEIVEHHAAEKIRVVGARHSWSRVVECPDVIVDMKHFDKIEIDTRSKGKIWATVGAGCRIERLLHYLQIQANATLPTLPVITHQTLAGAVATGTHGVGRSSLSHYVNKVRMVQWNPESGKAEIRVWEEGVGLQAARCHLGCLGIVLSLQIACVARYLIEESVARYIHIEDILAIEQDYPFTPFFLVPWRWDYVAQRRRHPSSGKGRSWHATLYQMYRLMVIEIGFNSIVKFMVRLKCSPRLIRGFYRHLFFLFVVRGGVVVDNVEKISVMNHQPFCHMEIEVFVPATMVCQTTEFLREILPVFGGLQKEVSHEVDAMLNRVGMYEEIFSLAGTYTHHYPILFRRVLPDDTLISMSSGTTEAWYGISFMTFDTQFDSFYAFAGFLARSMAALFGARPHWGKLCPLKEKEILSLYPGLEVFKKVCRTADPAGIFRNKFVQEKLGL
ncbi:MAG TPA: oxidoreductase [Nitrospiraceae bacterium]|nr:oxidoreductase [Nitrospiraceae bacterium]